MYSPLLPLIAVLLASSASAWSVTIYNNVADCKANGLTSYRILESEVNSTPSPADCFVFGEDMPGVTCTQYTQGGAQNGPCTRDKFLPMSVSVFPNGPAKCSFSVDQYCSSNSANKAPAFKHKCLSPSLQGGGPVYQYGSFKCSW